MDSRHCKGRRDARRGVGRPRIGREAPGRPPGAREKKGRMGGDGGVYPALTQRKMKEKNEKAIKFKR